MLFELSTSIKRVDSVSSDVNQFEGAVSAHAIPFSIIFDPLLLNVHVNVRDVEERETLSILTTGEVANKNVFSVPYDVPFVFDAHAL